MWWERKTQGTETVKRYRAADVDISSIDHLNKCFGVVLYYSKFESNDIIICNQI